MSGWNKRTGKYDLTITKASWWARRGRYSHIDTIEGFAKILIDAGIVCQIHPRWIECDASESRIYDVLRG